MLFFQTQKVIIFSQVTKKPEIKMNRLNKQNHGYLIQNF